MALSDCAGGAMINSFKDWVSVGVSYLGAGIRDYERWGKLMRLTFGPLVEPFARDIWEWAEGARCLKIPLKKARQNCWEFFNCGLQKSSQRSSDLHRCPAAIERRLDGVHGGKNAGRACWAVSGTLCGGQLQGGYPEKLKSCTSCDFYLNVRVKEEPFFIPAGTLAALITASPRPDSPPVKARGEYLES